jgi:hypothetical protein
MGGCKVVKASWGEFSSYTVFRIDVNYNHFKRMILRVTNNEMSQNFKETPVLQIHC